MPLGAGPRSLRLLTLLQRPLMIVLIRQGKVLTCSSKSARHVDTDSVAETGQGLVAASCCLSRDAFRFWKQRQENLSTCGRQLPSLHR